jgi:hypothetical protein
LTPSCGTLAASSSPPPKGHQEEEDDEVAVLALAEVPTLALAGVAGVAGAEAVCAGAGCWAGWAVSSPQKGQRKQEPPEFAVSVALSDAQPARRKAQAPTKRSVRIELSYGLVDGRSRLRRWATRPNRLY